MERNRKLIIALPLLLIIAVYVWLSNLNSSASKPQEAGKDSSASHHEVVSFIKDYSSAKVSMKSTLAWGEHNPFDDSSINRKIGKKIHNKIKNKSVVKYDLSGIFWNEQKPSAIINDLVVDIGSVVGSLTVKEILPGKVVLFDGTKDIVLMLRQN